MAHPEAHLCVYPCVESAQNAQTHQLWLEATTPALPLELSLTSMAEAGPPRLDSYITGTRLTFFCVHPWRGCAVFDLTQMHCVCFITPRSI